MAAANESQGLKIAVAVFVTLTVILGVTTYFAYSSYDQALAKQADAEQKSRTSQEAAASAIRDLTDLKKEAGYEKMEEYTAVKDAIKKDNTKVGESLTAMNGKIKAMVEAYKAAGGNAAKVDELSQAADQVVNQITTEPNQNFLGRQTRMLELLDNMTQLVTAYSLDNEDLRKTLAAVNGVNAQQLGVATTKAKESEDAKLKAETETQTVNQQLHDQVDKLQTELASRVADNTKLASQIEQLKSEHAKRVNDLVLSNRSLRELTEKNEITLDVPDGRITYVDSVRGEVRTTLSRKQGAREQMTFSIFDRNSPGVPTDRPKATIELIQVSDTGSIGRIVRTEQRNEPIRYQDIVYSPSWSPNSPQTYALIGKIDINRDGRDDREDLKRMIRSNGGEVAYDLPPTGIGQETGKLTPLTSWYVIDEREPIRGNTGRAGRGDAGDQETSFLTKKAEALRLARADGVRPITIERLLNTLGYRIGERVTGRVEAINRDAVDALTNPRGRVNVPAPSATSPDTPATDTPATDDPAPKPDADAPAGDDNAMPK